jgi:TctA family transporter
MTTLPMTWFEEQRLGRAVGILTGGTGLGIIVTGLLLPYLLSNLGKEAWRQCWLILALILGPQFEKYLGQSLIMGEGNPVIFFSRPISAILLIVAILLLVSPLLLRQGKEQRQGFQKRWRRSRLEERELMPSHGQRFDSQVLKINPLIFLK